MRVARALAKRVPYLGLWYRRSRERRNLRAIEERAGSSSPQDVFRYIYERNAWNSRESASGVGSELGRTEALRREFPRLLEQLETRTLLDVPCGDLNWISRVDLSGISYIGGDIVPELVESNIRRFGDASDGRKRFAVIDITRDELPVADTILSRDCLVHLSNDQVGQALENIQRSPQIKWMVLTQFDGVEENREIVTGRWRPTDLCRAPFNLPEPDFLLDEQFTERGAYQQYLGVWRLR